MELAAARQEGFVSNYLAEKDKISNRRPLIVIGILTRFDRKNNRDAIRKAWMASGILLHFALIYSGSCTKQLRVVILAVLILSYLFGAASWYFFS